MQAKLAERMDGVQQNKECQEALFELFSHCCKGPSGEESGECRRPNPPKAKLGNARRQIPQSGGATPPPSRTKIVCAPKHYSAAHRAYLLRHPHGGNTRSRTKTQAHTPRTNTSRAIDFGQERKRLNLHLRTGQGQ